MPTNEAPGACPACALSRWRRVANALGCSGWRAVRAALADYGETPAGGETGHDCARPVVWPAGSTGRGRPLFSPIDRHGTPQTGYPLSTRSITAIVAARLAVAETDDDSDSGPRLAPTGRAAAPGDLSDHDWGMQQRRDADQRFTAMEATLEQAEKDAEVILARVDAAMGGEVQSAQPGR